VTLSGLEVGMTSTCSSCRLSFRPFVDLVLSTRGMDDLFKELSLGWFISDKLGMNGKATGDLIAARLAFSVY